MPEATGSEPAPTWGGDAIAASPPEWPPATVQVAEEISATSQPSAAQDDDDLERYAQAPIRTSSSAPAPAPAPAPPAAGAPAAPPPAVMTDGRSGPLLIYEAQLRMGAYKVEETQRQIVAAIKELGGFMAQQEDQNRLVLRVPAQQFYPALEKLETLGQITQRYVRAQDVTDAFRDLEMRLRNAEAVRDRLVTLLDKAADVRQSLEVERELDRITERIELLKGQLKAMGDRIAFSTITIAFHEKRDEVINPDFQLPFEWLRFLGLQHLLSLPSP